MAGPAQISGFYWILVLIEVGRQTSSIPQSLNGVKTLLVAHIVRLIVYEHSYRLQSPISPYSVSNGQ